ncbi:hypothetical protein AO388_17520 [Pseudomonas sp. ICMP 10191]|nr:hypothetical protein AO388_17520 [Pseudomonas sp. ICMP 10191]
MPRKARNSMADDVACWNDCVQLLLGPPSLQFNDADKRRRQSLHLAAASLRAACEPQMAAAVQAEIDRMTSV